MNYIKLRLGKQEPSKCFIDFLRLLYSSCENRMRKLADEAEEFKLVPPKAGIPRALARG